LGPPAFRRPPGFLPVFFWTSQPKGLIVTTNNILNAWKQSESQDGLAAVAGTPIVDEALLRQVSGGKLLPSSGMVCTLSAECNAGQGSCGIGWPWW
jgi:hypothetical protein